jgi:hypothetical protein
MLRNRLGDGTEGPSKKEKKKEKKYKEKIVSRPHPLPSSKERARK